MSYDPLFQPGYAGHYLHQQAFPRGHPFTHSYPSYQPSSPSSSSQTRAGPRYPYAPAADYYDPQRGTQPHAPSYQVAGTEDYPYHTASASAGSAGAPSPHASGSKSKGREYLLGLTTSTDAAKLRLSTGEQHRADLDVDPTRQRAISFPAFPAHPPYTAGSPDYHKRLPPLPAPPAPPPLPARPTVVSAPHAGPSYSGSGQATHEVYVDPGPSIHPVPAGWTSTPTGPHAFRQEYAYPLVQGQGPYLDIDGDADAGPSYSYGTLAPLSPPGPSRTISAPPPSSQYVQNASSPSSRTRLIRPTAQIQAQVSQTPPKPKTFRPSVHPHCRPRLSEEAHLKPPKMITPIKPYSDPALGSSETKKQSTSTDQSKSRSKAKIKIKGNGAASSTERSGERGEKAKGRAKTRSEDDEFCGPIIDLTLSSDESTAVSSDSDSDFGSASPPTSTSKITPRSPARRKRAISEQPRSDPSLFSVTQTPKPTRDRLGKSARGGPSPSPSPSPAAGGMSGKAVQCSGFTRTGQPCKRLVKVIAPYLAVRDPNLPLPLPSSGSSEDASRNREVEDIGEQRREGEEGDEGDLRSARVLGRYCKDHAGMICQVGGFYWRGHREQKGVWIDFDEFIPPDLGQQTQTLLRMTMESKLTAKESPGFLYAYELKDLETPSLAFYKVGRTDNVPRRIGQWTHQCQSKTPTLRDIFPLPPPPPPLSSVVSRASVGADLHRSGTLTTSFLPGATTHRTPPLLAMKRWERLVHLELSDRCAQNEESGRAFERVREKCADCGLGHREIFPLVKGQNSPQGAKGERERRGEGSSGKRGGDVYEGVVVEVVVRWERFIRRITE